MHPILQIPEILSAIGQFMKASTLHSCIRVSTDFYASFSPLLWSCLNLHPHEHLVNANIARVHSHHVRRLCLTMTLSLQYFDIVFPNLQSLEFVYGSGRILPNSVEVLNSQAEFVRRHVMVKKLTLSSVLTPTSEFWDAVATWEKPTYLEVADTIIPSDASESFWLAVARFERIFFDYSAISPAVPTPGMIFPRLKEIKMEDLRGTGELGAVGQVMLLQACPNLETLIWHVAQQIDVGSQSMLETIGQEPFPELKYLTIHGYHFSDEILSALIGQCSQLRRLDTLSTRYALQSHTKLLAHHAATLETLRLVNIRFFRGRSAHEVLTMCPNLKHFEGAAFHLRDIIECSSPWVSHRLENLTMHIFKVVGDPPEWDREVFVRLARLTRLEILDLSWRLYLETEEPCFDDHEDNSDDDFEDTENYDAPRPKITRHKYDGVLHPTISLTLGAGLGLLEHLTELRELRFRRCAQSMTEEDIRWIIKHLHNITSVAGWFNLDDRRHHELGGILRRRGIKYIRQVVDQ
ncbi:hypothetical protein BGZ51_006888 [Haplosporangium sp. Z 767]|nr:hypothetical protein BGZ50_000205 [Haplosporangium sp. Z 11]KAF9191669.1 hypothetical protein BGZ51_006888 [Haplosporangium sp. Z 767]